MWFLFGSLVRNMSLGFMHLLANVSPQKKQNARGGSEHGEGNPTQIHSSWSWPQFGVSGRALFFTDSPSSLLSDLRIQPLVHLLDSLLSSFQIIVIIVRFFYRRNPCTTQNCPPPQGYASPRLRTTDMDHTVIQASIPTPKAVSRVPGPVR